jgi:hypothetical protein
MLPGRSQLDFCEPSLIFNDHPATSHRGPPIAYTATVDYTSLTPEQNAMLADRVGRDLRYYGKLRDRINKLGFPPHDPLFLAVSRAYDGLHAARVHLHYTSVTTGIGRRAR